MHFESSEQRIAFLKGKFEEITPKKAKSAVPSVENEHSDAETEKKRKKGKKK